MPELELPNGTSLAGMCAAFGSSHVMIFVVKAMGAEHGVLVVTALCVAALKAMAAQHGVILQTGEDSEDSEDADTEEDEAILYAMLICAGIMYVS